MEQEITKPSKLLDGRGELVQTGWSRQPLLDCNLETAAPKGVPALLVPWRIKKWDYYAVFTPTHFFSVTMADIGYAGSIFAYVLDFETHTLSEETLTIPFAKGLTLPRNSWEGRSVYKKGGLVLELIATPLQRNVRLNWSNFSKSALRFDLNFSTPKTKESIAITIPMGRRRFYWNRKLPCLPVEGSITFGDQSWSITAETSLGLLDWGRGVWPYHSHWVWAHASGFLTSRAAVSLNLGSGFGDTSRATENALVLNGRIHKLGKVKIEFDRKDYLKAWSMRDEAGRLELSFMPFKERVAKTDLSLIMTRVHQIFGHYNGWVKSDEGEKVAITNLRGFAEEHFARW